MRLGSLMGGCGGRDSFGVEAAKAKRSICASFSGEEFLFVEFSDATVCMRFSTGKRNHAGFESARAEMASASCR